LLASIRADQQAAGDEVADDKTSLARTVPKCCHEQHLGFLMSHGHGAMERYLLAALTQNNECSARELVALHPDAAVMPPSRSLRSSLGRALRKLEAEKKIVRVRYEIGDRGRVLHGGNTYLLTGAYANRKATAYHEAGHAVIARIFSMPVKYATIKPTSDSAGHVSINAVAHKMRGKEAQENSIVVDFAGALAELEFFERRARSEPEAFIPNGAIAAGARGDNKSIKNKGYELVARPHKDAGFLVYKPDYRSLRFKLKRRARHLVRKYSTAIERVAEELIAHETLNGKQIDEIIAVSANA
jgi:hypothetical protein